MNYLTTIKSIESNKKKFLNDLDFLEHLINNKTFINIADYQELITYFLRNKCIDTSSKYATLIKINPSILTSNHTFKLPSQLIDKTSNKQFITLYEDSDDHFLNDYYYKADLVIFALGQLGLITKILPNEFVLSLANKVRQIRETRKAKELSVNLLKYCQLNTIPSVLLNQLLNIEWVIIDSLFYKILVM